MAVCLLQQMLLKISVTIQMEGGGEWATLIKLSIINTNTLHLLMKLIYTFIYAGMFLFYLETILCKTKTMFKNSCHLILLNFHMITKSL